MASRTRLTYIASPSFSGSTLLAFLLNAHPDVACIGELKWGDINLEEYRCSCGTLLCECGFWQQVVRDVQGRGAAFSLARPATDFRCRSNPIVDRVARARVRGPLFEHARKRLLALMPAARRTWPLVRNVNRATVEAVLQLAGARVFADASKDPVRLLHLWRTGDYEIQVVHLVRDGRGVTYSTIKNERTSARFAALEWLRTHRQIDRIATLFGSHCLVRVKYEDLCNDPHTALRRLFGFLRLPPCNLAGFRSGDHHILGNAMRLHNSTDIRLDEKWRTQLSSRDLAVFEQIGGRLNRRYGYS